MCVLKSRKSARTNIANFENMMEHEFTSTNTSENTD